MFVQGNGLVVYFEERGMVDGCTCDETVQLDGLDGQQANDAPHGFRRQVADGDEQQAIDGIEHQDIAIVESHVDKTEYEE